MSTKKIWFITGASSADVAEAALAPATRWYHRRESDAVSKTLGQSNDLLAVKLDVTSRADAEPMRLRTSPARPLTWLVHSWLPLFTGIQGNGRTPCP